MAKHPTAPLIPVQKRWSLMILLCIALSTAVAFFIGASFSSCNSRDYSDNHNFDNPIRSFNSQGAPSQKEENPLSFMKSKLVLLVSHELSLSGTLLASFFAVFFLIQAWFSRVLVNFEKWPTQLHIQLLIQLFMWIGWEGFVFQCSPCYSEII